MGRYQTSRHAQIRPPPKVHVRCRLLRLGDGKHSQHTSITTAFPSGCADRVEPPQRLERGASLQGNAAATPIIDRASVVLLLQRKSASRCGSCLLSLPDCMPAPARPEEPAPCVATGDGSDCHCWIRAHMLPSELPRRLP